MRALFVASFLVLLPLSAAADHIGIYGDASGLSCTLTPPSSGAFDVYVIHHASGARSGVAFRVGLWLESGLNTAGWEVTTGSRGGGNLGYPPNDPYYGGIGIVYGWDVCRSGDIPVLTLHLIATGPVAGDRCNHLRIEAHDYYGGPHAYSCNFQAALLATGGRLFFTTAPGQCEDCGTVATARTTWGAVKALYR